MTTLMMIPFGLLPTRSMLHARVAGVSAGSLLDVMRESLRRDGPNDGLHAMLRAVGFTWGPPPGVTDLDLDVAAVAAALQTSAPSPAVSPSDSRHSAVEPGPAPTRRSGRQIVPGTTGEPAGEQLYPAHASRRVGELAELLGGES